MIPFLSDTLSDMMLHKRDRIYDTLVSVCGSGVDSFLAMALV
jgi:hypothetical protein